MTQKQKLAVEQYLINAIKAFHDIDDKTKREEYVKDYFFKFCTENEIDPEEAYMMVENYLNHQRKTTSFQYEHFKNLKELLFNKQKENDDREDR